MRYNREDIEVMSPVGSYESLMAAIQGGANSVYFGVEQLNMRAKSSNNFTIDDLHEIVGIAKKHNIKSYLTVNTVIYNQDLEIMRKVIKAAKEANVSAIIASDISAIQYARTIGVEVHISTQLNISNIDAVKFFSQYADVIVMARELDLKQINEIYKAIDFEQIKGPSGNLVKLELFAHGALCMSISGKCYLSLHEYNMSANRGACLQICRRGYTVTDNDTGRQLQIVNEHIMSPKDLLTIDFLDKILKAGIRVLKLEGRARSPEYVKTITQCYSEAVDAIINGTYNVEKVKIWKEKLKTVFNRGFWDGYYLGRKLGEWSDAYGSKATKKKIYIGKGTNYFSKLKVAEFLIETENLKVGDEILITGPTTGVIETEVKEIRVDLKNVEVTKKGETCSIPINEIVRRSDKLYKVVEVKEEF